jgi:threonine dehydratase
LIALDDIERARARIRDAVYLSPCARSQTLSARLDCELYLKLENLQMTGSFKERGALNKLLCLDAEERARGVIAASAGNHAQGLAFVAKQRGVPTTIVMPCGTPLIKVSATRSHAARVILHGDSYDEAAEEAGRLALEHGLVQIHPFDDDAVIAGQGTIGLELLEQVPRLQAVLVPVGGGGLAAGVATAIKSRAPHVAVYGVELRLLPSMKTALQQGVPVALEPVRTLGEGIAVRRVSARTLAAAQRYLDDLVLVDEEELAEAVLTLLENEKTVAEGAGAASLAAALQGALPLAGKRVAVVVSGGNIDVNRLSRIIDRGLVKSGRSMRIRVLIPDVPGALAQLLGTIAALQANVLQVSHDRLAARIPPGLAAYERVL